MGKPGQFSFAEKREIARALLLRGDEQEFLFARARQVRDVAFSGRVEVRSVIEYSNICGQECAYCGMNRRSGVLRYVMEERDFCRRMERLYKNGRRVIMVQAGESRSQRYFDRLYGILKEVRDWYPDLVLICSFGNLDREKYAQLREIGIERYLLKFETSDPRLYKRIKPSDTLKNRLAHILTLKKLGFSVSSGNITGLPGQTIPSLAGDLLLLKELDVPMGSTSVFIPNEMSPYRHHPAGDIEQALNFTAVLRIMNPSMLIPATSSLELAGDNGISLGLKAGANTVTLHDGTGREDEENYIIYTRKRCRPREILFDIVRDNGLALSRFSLLRHKPEETLFYKLVNANFGGNGKAVYCEDGVFTYRDLYELSSRFCSFLMRSGLKEQSKAILALYDSIEFITAFLSCLRLGIVPIPVDPRMERPEWDGLLSAHGDAWILTTGSMGKKLRGAKVLAVAEDSSSDFFLSLIKRLARTDTIVGVDRNNPALILYTSGSTGSPKGVVHTYQHLFTDNFPRFNLRMNADDISFSCSRIFSSFGLGNSLLFPFHSGAGVILSRGIPNPWTIMNLVKVKPTLFFAVPSMYEFLLRQKEDFSRAFSNVRLFISSGEKLYCDVLKKWETRYRRPLLECFGSTEMCHPFISHTTGNRDSYGCGKPVQGFKIRFSKNGTMFCRGPSLFSGYYGDDELTRKKLKHGWFRCEDAGYRDSKGFVFITGRKNSVFKVNGSWVCVPDIENKLRDSGLVKDAAVLVRPEGLDFCIVPARLSRRFGRDRSVPTAGSDIRKMIRGYCMKHLRAHEMPKGIYTVRSIPRTGSGKIDRRRLVREKYRGTVQGAF